MLKIIQSFVMIRPEERRGHGYATHPFLNRVSVRCERAARAPSHIPTILIVAHVEAGRSRFTRGTIAPSAHFAVRP